MTNLVETYKKLYNLKTINVKGVKEGSISFMFFDYEDFYSLGTENFISYSSNIGLRITDLVFNIEKIYDIKIFNFFPVCFTNNDSMLFACKIKKKSEKLVSLNKEVIKPIAGILKREIKYFTDDYDDELLLIEKYHRRYNFYQNFIKKYILTEKKRRKREYLNLLNKFITEDDKKIVDVSCGDNKDIFKLYNENRFIVGNDINCYHVRNGQAINKSILFTNDNLLKLNYKDDLFDIAYCKNTLHHLNGQKELQGALENLKRISKKIIIVEIEDPKVTGGMPKFLNKYLYIKYLKDAGKKFLNFKVFKKSIDSVYNDECNISYLTFENVLGKYMIAIIEKR